MRLALWLAQAVAVLVLVGLAIGAVYPAVCVVGIAAVEVDGRVYVNARWRVLLWNPLAACPVVPFNGG